MLIIIGLQLLLAAMFCAMASKIAQRILYRVGSKRALFLYMFIPLGGFIAFAGYRDLISLTMRNKLCAFEEVKNPKIPIHGVKGIIIRQEIENSLGVYGCNSKCAVAILRYEQYDFLGIAVNPDTIKSGDGIRTYKLNDYERSEVESNTESVIMYYMYRCQSNITGFVVRIDGAANTEEMCIYRKIIPLSSYSGMLKVYKRQRFDAWSSIIYLLAVKYYNEKNELIYSYGSAEWYPKKVLFWPNYILVQLMGGREGIFACSSRAPAIGQKDVFSSKAS